MFSKLAVVFIAAMATLTAAAPNRRSDIDNSCNTGKTYCCNDVYDAKSKQANVILQLVHADVDPNTKVGVTCNPISIAAIGEGSSCSSQPVCCSDNEMSGLVVWGCSPVNINL